MEKGKKATVGGGVQTIGEEGEETMVEVEKGKETNIGRRKVEGSVEFLTD